MQLIHEVYGLLLSFFPKNYREEYGEELQIVFRLLLDDAAKIGRLELTWVILRELVSLPKAILVQHLRERSKAHKVKNFVAYFNFIHGSWREFASALCPFLLFGIFSPLIDLLTKSGLLAPRGMLVNGIGIALLVVLGILFLAGLFSGLPRWFLPYIGFLLSLVSVYGFSQLLGRYVMPSQHVFPQSWIGREIVYQGFLWGGLTVLTILLAALIVLFPSLRRFKTDCTILPFLLYGAVPFALAFTFDDYVNDDLPRLVAFLIVVAGIWFYLHTDNPRLRFWALFGAMTISLLFAAGAKAIIYQYFWDGLRYFTWWTEMTGTVIMWGWIALSMLIPTLLSGSSSEGCSPFQSQAHQ